MSSFGQTPRYLVDTRSADALSQLLTIPPYVIAGIVLCLTCYASDRLQSRGILAATACVVAGLGYMYVFFYCLRLDPAALTRGIKVTSKCVLEQRAILRHLSDHDGRVHHGRTCTCLVSVPYLSSSKCHMFSSFVLFSVSHNFGSETKTAAGVALFNSLGHCGSILGSHLFPSKEGPRYVSVLSFPIYPRSNIAYLSWIE